ncbi:MAG TPA: carboxypeptidase-like regulatory domain-containing protein [Puia sp.]|nr:carboxypeptidase-like regulatory domain-containing protein [Puia sp.]
MKNKSWALAAAFLMAAALFGFVTVRDGSVKGMVTPVDGGINVWADSGTDTLKSQVHNGAFEIAGAKPGTYKLVVEAKPPYRNAAKDNVSVTDGQTTDVGEIRLER